MHLSTQTLTLWTPGSHCQAQLLLSWYLTTLAPGLVRVVVSCLISLHTTQNMQLGKQIFLEEVLGGLLLDHFEEGGKLANFPKSLLGYGEDQLDVFVRDHEGVVVPLA